MHLLLLHLFVHLLMHLLLLCIYFLLYATIRSGVRQGAESAPPAGRVRPNTPAGRGLMQIWLKNY